MDFVELCRKLISIDSTPSQGSHEAASWLAELAREKGLHAELQTEIIGEVQQSNVIIRRDATRPAQEIMFQTHLDTPDPGPFGLWTKTGQNPFDAHIIDGEIYGLGAADCKLDFLCKLEALVRFKDEMNPDSVLPPVLVGSFGEETGMTGALRIIRKNKIAAKYGLIGEASELHAYAAGNGFGLVEIHVPFEDDEADYRNSHNLLESSSTISRTFIGKSAHSSVPDRGESAIMKMIAVLEKLPQDLAIMEIGGGVNSNTVPAQAFLEFDTFSGFKLPMAKKLNLLFQTIRRLEQEFMLHKDLDFTPATPTLNIGAMRTTDSGVSMTATVRMPPIISNEIYESWMNKIRETCGEINAEVRLTDYKRPYRTDSQGTLARVTKSILNGMKLSPETGTHSSTNEASLFSRVGVECISFGPGVRAAIHTSNEHVRLDDLHRATEFYLQVMQRMCL